MKCSQNYLVCVISNRVSRDVLAVNPNLKTTKRDAANHGFGTRIIRQTVEQQNGIFHVEVIDGFFVAKVMLPILQSLA
jgi:two-component sensor histidine kinase